MANTPVWGQESDPGKYHDQDLITLTAQERTQNEVASIIKVNDVNQNDDVKIAIHAINSSTDSAARALMVEGKAQIDKLLARKSDAGTFGTMHLDAINGHDLQIGTDPSNGDIYLGADGKVVTVEGTALHLKGTVVTDPINADEANLELGTDADWTNDVVISTQGHPTTVQGSLEVAEATTLDEVTVGDVLTAEGELLAQGQVKVGPSDGPGTVDSGGSAESPQDLKIGTNAGTNDVIIAKQDQTTIIDCNLRVGRSLVGAVHTSRIDAYGDGGNADSLHIGTLDHTNAVSIGRSGYETTVRGDLDVEENLQVGPIDDEGYIDAGGVQGQPQDLVIGSDADETNNVLLSRTGKVADVKGRVDAEEHIRVGTSANDGDEA